VGWKAGNYQNAGKISGDIDNIIIIPNQYDKNKVQSWTNNARAGQASPGEGSFPQYFFLDMASFSNILISLPEGNPNQRKKGKNS
jgi:hypothetical protein